MNFIVQHQEGAYDHVQNLPIYARVHEHDIKSNMPTKPFVNHALNSHFTFAAITQLIPTITKATALSIYIHG